jgi:hypothetical protein
MDKLLAAFEKFDNYNKADPHVFTWGSITYPQEFFLALKLHEWVLKLSPHASEELLLASRSQHIGRWEIPRDSYPEGREPYLLWRKDLAKHHAAVVTHILQEVGYAAEQVNRVTQIILKQRIKADAEVQVIENALCLVFLQFQYEEFLYKHSREKVVNIIKRSLLKMDQAGHQEALNLQYSTQGLDFIKEALTQIGNFK